MTGHDKLAEEIGELKMAIAEGALKAKQLDEPDLCCLSTPTCRATSNSTPAYLSSNTRSDW